MIRHSASCPGCYSLEDRQGSGAVDPTERARCCASRKRAPSRRAPTTDGAPRGLALPNPIHPAETRAARNRRQRRQPQLIELAEATNETHERITATMALRGARHPKIRRACSCGHPDHPAPPHSLPGRGGGCPSPLHCAFASAGRAGRPTRRSAGGGGVAGWSGARRAARPADPRWPILGGPGDCPTRQVPRVCSAETPSTHEHPATMTGKGSGPRGYE